MRRLLVCIALALSLGGWTHGVNPVLTADPAANQQTQNVLIYLQNIGQRASHKIVTGQYFGSAACCSSSEYPAAGWAANIAALVSATGQTPGMIGADYNDYNQANGGTGAVSYTLLNSYLISAAQAGSLVQIQYHAKNPWTGGPWSDESCGGTLADLVNPAKPVYTAWHSQLANVAAGLQALQAAGVTVIWRPFLEANSSPWWWMACNHNMSQLGAVWQDMFTTFTTTYGLHNLLWAYSSNGPWQNMNGCPGVQGESGLCLYPGSVYVDIVGIDDYSDATGPMPDAFPDNWRAWSALGKVVGFPERGPSTQAGTSTVFQTLVPGMIANRVASGPAGVFFMAYSGGNSIVSNLGASTLMNDSNAANQPNVGAALSCMALAATYAARVACVLN